MDPYLFSLSLGGAGLGVMALSGLGQHFGHGGRGDGGHGHAGHGHAGHASSGHANGGDIHAGHGHVPAMAGGVRGAASGARGMRGARDGHGARTTGGGGGMLSRALWAITSPRVVFSLLVGFGATGLLARDAFGEPIALAAAIAGGLAFERLLVGPLWNLLFRFASEPSATLESAIMNEARATSGFDARGQGLISLELNGQIIQLLATLLPEDRNGGVRVHAGDRLRIEDVDGHRSRCTVRYLGRD